MLADGGVGIARIEVISKVLMSHISGGIVRAVSSFKRSILGHQSS